MTDTISSLLGLDAGSLNAGQMALRAVLTFAITLAIIRIGSKRLFGKGTAFDTIVAIMIGSIMSRAITGSSPLGPTWAAGATLVALHWLVALLSSRYRGFGAIVKGKPVALIRDGEILEDGLESAELSHHDLEQGILAAGHDPDPERIALARLERDGSISVVAAERPPRVLEVTVEDGVQTVRIAVE